MAQEGVRWWENRVLRSVDNLRLWRENPRLDPSSQPVKVRDYVEELISDINDKQDFIDLLISIAKRGFVSFDPVVVWQDEHDKYFYVAEGNRRVMALKLLRSPEKSPNSIRKIVTKLAREIDRDAIEKIKVCISPNYDDARWYILQRHSNASNQVRWQRLQQQRFIITVYDSTGQDIDETIKLTGFKRASIVEALRYVKIRDIATRQEVTNYLSIDEKELVYSHRINMTVLERWFGNSQVRDGWHIEFSDVGIIINANLNDFYIAYARFLKLMLNKDNELGIIVNTRTIDSHFQKIFEFLPKVRLASDDEKDSPSSVKLSEDEKKPAAEPDSRIILDSNEDLQNPEPEKDTGNESKPSLKGNPNRGQLTDIYYEIKVRSYKIRALFEELQKLPLRKYPNVSAASIRIFLELSVDEFINNCDLQQNVAKRAKKAYNEVTLSQKLSILRGELIGDKEADKIIDQLLHNSNDFSLNTLNEYIHGTKIHKVERQFLNRFWDMLMPLLSVLISLKEI
ncbi:ParB/Srx family N-terminal domain-containing protein [Pantoea agglomerans]|uniref:ParB/Srx family N-terminal domain-containing protein n=1 Tax=Enterobacter agglomerans TaxID=549 RepID=UPI002A6AB4D0|nr:ParB/Srx family N-terminal domain-containing protein [Pantoea agglomerans]MDY0994944.1 ParB/Srx family N-terminal domain-containing protein [Pantoea agglomerans]